MGAFRRIVVLAVAVAGSGLAGGCVKHCHTVGMTSGVGVSLPSPEWRLTKFCLDDRCATAPELGYLPVDDSPAEYEMVLEFLDPEGTLTKVRSPLETYEFEINGKGCPPLTANAVVVVDDTGNVQIRPFVN